MEKGTLSGTPNKDTGEVASLELLQKLVELTCPTPVVTVLFSLSLCELTLPSVAPECD